MSRSPAVSEGVPGHGKALCDYQPERLHAARHFPLETETLRREIERAGGQPYDGEILCPFFCEGGRYTLGNVHYVKEGDRLVPAGQTEFARDRSFGYTHSRLDEWCEEKTAGAYPASETTCIPLEMLRRLDVDGVAQLLTA